MGHPRVTSDLVRSLLQRQAPYLLEGRELAPFAHGWDNEILALGDDLLVRCPRRELAGRLVRHEQLVLPVLAPRLPVPVPEVVYEGRPQDGYPWHWSVVRHLPGTVALDVPVGERSAHAPALARALAAFHQPVAPGETPPANAFRGVPLADREHGTREDIEALAARGIHLPDGTPVGAEIMTALWDEWSTAPAWSGPPVWVHGDPHAGNVLLDPVGLIDFGDVTSGDPACDLAAAHLVFDAQGAAAFIAETQSVGPHDEATWTRARAWALRLALAIGRGPQNRLRDECGRVLADLLTDHPDAPGGSPDG